MEWGVSLQLYTETEPGGASKDDCQQRPAFIQEKNWLFSLKRKAPSQGHSMETKSNTQSYPGELWRTDIDEDEMQMRWWNRYGTLLCMLAIYACRTPFLLSAGTRKSFIKRLLGALVHVRARCDMILQLPQSSTLCMQLRRQSIDNPASPVRNKKGRIPVAVLLFLFLLQIGKTQWFPINVFALFSFEAQCVCVWSVNYIPIF